MATELRTLSLIMAEHVVATRPRTVSGGRVVDADAAYADWCSTAVKPPGVRAGGKPSGALMARPSTRTPRTVEWGSVSALVRGRV